MKAVSLTNWCLKHKKGLLLTDMCGNLIFWGLCSTSTYHQIKINNLDSELQHKFMISCLRSLLKI